MPAPSGTGRQIVFKNIAVDLVCVAVENNQQVGHVVVVDDNAQTGDGGAVDRNGQELRRFGGGDAVGGGGCHGSVVWDSLILQHPEPSQRVETLRKAESMISNANGPRG